jgi:hypothetical protein
MYGNFRKSKIIPFSQADERDIKKAYNSVKLDVSEVILKTAISLTS